MISILIPTYNRKKYLEKNLLKLATDISSLSFEKDIEIIISNNASTDNTTEVVDNFIRNHPNIQIFFFSQPENIGLEANALFVLEKATSKFVMYLGDDDFISREFLLGVMNEARRNNKLSCILPSFQNVDYDGNPISSGRDIGLTNSLYEAGFSNCLANSYRGHQLSGLVFKREGLLKSYRENKVHNIYPFIYFVSICGLNGQTWHFPEYPVLVTSPLQKDKDWDYNINGLISEIFDNYKKLPGISSFQRFKLEFQILQKQRWRYEIHLQKGKLRFLKSIYSIISSKNTSNITRLVFPSYIVAKKIRKIVRKCLP